MSDHHAPEDRQQEVLSAVLKFLGIVVVVGLVILVGTKVVVSQLDLDEVTTGPVGGGVITGPPVLPTTALPDPTISALPTPTEEPTEEPTEIPEPTITASPGQDGLTLSMSPVFVEAGDRIEIMGEWPGKDRVSLRVQRFEDGEWVDFGVQASVKIGSYSTYVLTSREGENRFRMYHPDSDTASNEVVVTVD